MSVAATGGAGTAGGRGRQSISAVVFDLGGVLLDWDPGHVLDDDALRAVDIDAVQHELDLGRPVDEVRDRVHAAAPDRGALIDHYLTHWQRTIAGEIAAVVAVLADLRERPVGLYALSNFSGALFREARPRFAFLEWFDGLVISGDEGLVKPDPRIYRLLVDRHGLQPARTVFIDDRRDNVVAARRVGLVAIRFRSAPALRDELEALGVL